MALHTHLEQSAGFIIQFEGTLAKSAPGVADEPISFDREVSVVGEVTPEVYDFFLLFVDLPKCLHTEHDGCIRHLELID